MRNFSSLLLFLFLLTSPSLLYGQTLLLRSSPFEAYAAYYPRLSSNSNISLKSSSASKLVYWNRSSNEATYYCYHLLCVYPHYGKESVGVQYILMQYTTSDINDSDPSLRTGITATCNGFSARTQGTGYYYDEGYSGGISPATYLRYTSSNGLYATFNNDTAQHTVMNRSIYEQWHANLISAVAEYPSLSQTQYPSFTNFFRSDYDGGGVPDLDEYLGGTQISNWTDDADWHYCAAHDRWYLDQCPDCTPTEPENDCTCYACCSCKCVCGHWSGTTCDGTDDPDTGCSCHETDPPTSCTCGELCCNCKCTCGYYTANPDCTCSCHDEPEEPDNCTCDACCSCKCTCGGVVDHRCIRIFR